MTIDETLAKLKRIADTSFGEWEKAIREAERLRRFAAKKEEENVRLRNQLKDAGIRPL